MIRFTATDWIKTLAIAFTIVVVAFLAVALESQFGHSYSQWRSLRHGLENIDSEMKKRDDALGELAP